MGTRIKIHREVKGPIQDEWQLCFQHCTYIYGDDARPQNIDTPTQDGFRFIWRKPNGKLNAARGQARLPDADQVLELLDKAKEQGWFMPKTSRHFP